MSYIVLESGNWELEDGTLLEVSSLTTEAAVGKRISNVWETISLISKFGETPVVLSQVQSYNDPGWVGTRQRNASANSFQMAMEAEESATVRHSAEVVGWMAIEPGEGTWSGMLYEAGHTPDRVSHKWYSISFGQNYAQAPRFVAALAKYDGSDSSHLRYQSLTSASVQIKVEEDTTYDKEKNHTKEVVDYIAVAADGLLTVPGGVIQPTPVPSPTPKPTNTPTPTNTPEPTAAATDTPLPTDTPTDTPDIPIPTGTGTPYSTSTPLPQAQCDLITIDQHYVSSPSFVFMLVRNSNPTDVYLTESYLEWPTHAGMYLDWLYFNGYYYTGDDYESPNNAIVDPPEILDANSTAYWYAGFAVRPDDWKTGNWNIELTINETCVVPYSFQYFEPTPVPPIEGTGTVTPTNTPGS